MITASDLIVPSTFPGDETASFFGFLGVDAALVFSCMGAVYGTPKRGVGVASMGVMRFELLIRPEEWLKSIWRLDYSWVLIPETTFVGVESRVLIPETTVWDTLVYPSDTLVIQKDLEVEASTSSGKIWRVSIAGTPPHDVIEEMAETIVTTISAHKNECAELLKSFVADRTNSN
ncbi:hypothetical protein Tco_0011773 [Tanacetum coccineum]